MKITRETDYALRIMRYLALADSMKDAKTISENTGVPARFTVKILSKLAAAKTVVSRKGTGGGYSLACEPEKITMRGIVETIEGPLVISRCLGDDFICQQGCGQVCSCYFNRVFDEINALIAEKLDSITLRDVINGSSGNE